MIKEALSFDDVLIVPKYSKVISRQDVNLNSSLPGVFLGIPFIASPMKTVCGPEMAIELDRLGCLGILHRFDNLADRLYSCRAVAEHTGSVSFAIGINEEEINFARKNIKDLNVQLICIDIAHGHHIHTERTIKALRDIGFEGHIMAGNIATGEALEALNSWGCNSARISVGGGKCCSTRVMTQVGVPTLSAVMDCYSIKKDKDLEIAIVSDGGHETSGHVALALAAGSDVVMLGGLLAATKESPGPKIRIGSFPNEKLCKKYMGSASMESKIDRGDTPRHVEGGSTILDYKGPVERIIHTIEDGLRSSMSYVGAFNLEEFKTRAEFIRITNAGLVESGLRL